MKILHDDCDHSTKMRCDMDFNAFSTDEGHLLTEALHQEAGVVQGRRRSKRDDDWSEEIRNDGVGGGDDVSHVIYMRGRPLQFRKVSSGGSGKKERMSLERMFAAFCFLQGIPYLPQGDSQRPSSGPSFNTFAGKKRRKSSAQPPPQKEEDNKQKSDSRFDGGKRRIRGDAQGGRDGAADGDRSQSDRDISTASTSATGGTESSSGRSTTSQTQSEKQNLKKKRRRSEVATTGRRRRSSIFQVPLGQSPKPRVVRPSAVSFMLSQVDLANIVDERDKEWLRWSSSDKEIDEEKLEGNNSDENPLDSNLDSFLTAIKLVTRMRIGLGLNPYTTVVHDKVAEVRWDPKSKEFITVCLSSIVFFAATVNILSSILFITMVKEPSSTTQKIIKITFANHVTSCLTSSFITLFLSVWGVSCVMELGVQYAEFLSRFNEAIVLTKYNLSHGIHHLIVTNLVGLTGFLSSLIIIFFGGREIVPFVREASGYLGFAILRPLSFDMRESIYFPLVEIFGLLVFLYIFACFDIVLLEFAVYAKALENMGRRYNLRLAYRLGRIGERVTSDGKIKIVRKAIPLHKLLAEHLTILSVMKHFSQVNAIVFFAFIQTIALQNVLVMYTFFQLFQASSDSWNLVEPDLRYIDHVGHVSIAVPLRLFTGEGEALVNAAVALGLFLTGLLLLGGIMHDAGDAIQVSIEYVRRYGFTLCRNAKERRFILSMINTFSSKAPEWIGRGFTFNRSFILTLAGFVTGASMVMASFHPERVKLASIEQCDLSGVCKLYNTNRNRLHVLYAAIPFQENQPPPPIVIPEVPVTGTTTTTAKSTLTFEWKPEPGLIIQPACSAQGALPFSATEYVTECRTIWRASRLPSIVRLPVLSREMEAINPNTASGKKYVLFEKLPDKHTCREGVNGYDADCFNTRAHIHFVDDCNSPLVSRVNVNGQGQMEAKLRLVYTYDIPGASTEDLMCCYEYTGYPDSRKQARTCNKASSTAFNTHCRFGAGNNRPWLDNKYLKIIRKELLSILAKEKEKNGNADGYLDKNERVLLACHCVWHLPPSKDLDACLELVGVDPRSVT